MPNSNSTNPTAYYDATKDDQQQQQQHQQQQPYPQQGLCCAHSAFGQIWGNGDFETNQKKNHFLIFTKKTIFELAVI